MFRVVFVDQDSELVDLMVPMNSDADAAAAAVVGGRLVQVRNQCHRRTWAEEDHPKIMFQHIHYIKLR